MAKQIFIRLLPHAPGTDELDDSEPASQVSWLRLDGADSYGEVYHSSLAEAANMTAGRQVIVFAPGSDVLLVSAAVPSQNRQRIARALPYLLEDRLGSEVEDLHFALGERRADGQINAAVVDRKRLSSWLTELRQAGIQPDSVVPDILALPMRPGTWQVLKEPLGALVRTATQAGFAVDNDNLDMMLAMALVEAGVHKPASLELIDCTGAATALTETAAVDAEIDIRIEHSSAPPLALLAKAYNAQTAINLLQGDFSRREQLGKLWRPWRPAAALLAVWLVVQGGLMVSEVSRLSDEAPRLKQEVEQIYRQAFPGARNIPNPRAQMETALNDLRGGGQSQQGFLELLAYAGAPLSDVPSLQLRTVTYKEGELNLDFEIQDLQTLDQLKQRLSEDAGLDIEIQSATARDDKVEGRLQIRPKTS